jgi:HEAT repeat protein
MSSLKQEQGGRPEVKVKRAATSVRRAIDRLVQLLGDEDPAVVGEATLALQDLGARATLASLSAALPGAAKPGHRAALILLLGTLGRVSQIEVAMALTEAWKRERDPEIATFIRAALSFVICPDRPSGQKPEGS